MKFLIPLLILCTSASFSAQATELGKETAFGHPSLSKIGVKNVMIDGGLLYVHSPQSLTVVRPSGQEVTTLVKVEKDVMSLPNGHSERFTSYDIDDLEISAAAIAAGELYFIVGTGVSFLSGNRDHSKSRPDRLFVMNLSTQQVTQLDEFSTKAFSIGELHVRGSTLVLEKDDKIFAYDLKQNHPAASMIFNGKRGDLTVKDVALSEDLVTVSSVSASGKPGQFTVVELKTGKTVKRYEISYGVQDVTMLDNQTVIYVNGSTMTQIDLPTSKSTVLPNKRNGLYRNLSVDLKKKVLTYGIDDDFLQRSFH